jgi:ABC-2 type transport system permease protein
MLKYVYTTPIGLLSYLFGRAATKLVMSIVSCAVLLAFGLLVLHIPLHLTPERIALFAVCLVVGILGVTAVGLVMAGCALVFPRQAMSVNDSAAAVLYLLCGAVFPPDILPHVMREAAFALPLTYWIEACRRALVGPGFSAQLASIGTPQLVFVQCVVTLGWLAAGYALYSRMEQSAQRAGKLDQTTDF